MPANTTILLTFGHYLVALKAEVAGSNPVGATRTFKVRATFGSGLFPFLKRVVKKWSK